MEKFSEFRFRNWVVNTYGDSNEPYFRAVDIAKVIDYSNGSTRDMLELVDESEKFWSGLIPSTKEEVIENPNGI